jgi:hypothetical protein
MNKDAEAINQFLAWLTQPDPVMSPSGPITNPFRDFEDSGAMDLPSDIDPLDSEVEAMKAELPESSAIFVEDISSLELGELPAVQDRFHAIIKRRLRTEIERNPPLFPWETRLWDYESEQPDWAIAPTSVWTAQLQALKLPIAVPQAQLLQIFAECRKLADTSLKQGVKLVRAVESLFPDDLAALNYWAGQVLAEPVRGTSTLTVEGMQSYEQADSTQQMVLSLLAAQQLLASMNLEISPAASHLERQWLTAAGELVLTLDYQADRLRIQGQMPAAGRLTLESTGHQTGHQTVATCTQAELLTVELGLASGETCTLEVELVGAEAPLVFTVALIEDL